MGHMKINRIFHRVLEELDATRKIANVTSWSDAFATLRAKVDIQIMNYSGYKESETFKKHLLKKHEVMLKYYEKIFFYFLNSYIYKPKRDNEKDMSDCVWVCWWQGLEQAPEIVKKCVDSIQKNAGEHPVVILTEENYREYVEIPEWLEEKRNKGIISRTHYSDFLRVELLAEHGGIWLDATFLCTGLNIENYFDLPLWSIKRPDYGHASVAGGYFANYSLGCNFSSRKVFEVIRDYLLEYWRINNTLTDYLFLDYLIVLVQKYDEEIKRAFDNIPENNALCDELFKVLGEPFDINIWNELKQNTSLFKLTWKQKFLKKKNGKKTFYGMLLDETM